jgi:hypothetical protein
MNGGSRASFVKVQGECRFARPQTDDRMGLKCGMRTARPGPGKSRLVGIPISSWSRFRGSRGARHIASGKRADIVMRGEGGLASIIVSGCHPVSEEYRRV